MKCPKHNYEMAPMECSRCLGEGVVFREDDLTGAEFPERCFVCSGTGDGGYFCEDCAEENAAP